MTREEMEMRKLVRESDVIDRTNGSPLAKAFNHLWEKYVEQEPCEDAVSREAVRNIVNDIRDCISVEGYWAILERLKKLSSVNPQPKTDTLDKIRDEIKDRPSYMLPTSSEFERGVNAMLSQSLMIIDKYKAESEDE